MSRECVTIARMLKTPALRVLVVCTTVVLSLAFACQSGGPPKVRAERVVMVSFDGVGADLAWRWIADGTAASFDGLRTMAEDGLSVERLRMVDPTLTSVNHAALVTGRTAAATGIVSNSFHRSGTPITERVSGFTASNDAETLWMAARRQGLRVGTLVWPGADARALDRMGDFGVVWPGPPLAPSEVVVLEPESSETTGEIPSADGLPPLLWRLNVALPGAAPQAFEILIAAVDSDPDGKPRYDAAAVRLVEETAWRYLGEREWLDLAVEARSADDLAPHRYAAWCKILHLDRRRGALRLYRGAVYRLVGYPDAFEGRLVEAIGPWPGPPDEPQVAAWWLDLEAGIDLETFIEQGERLDRYLDRMAEWVMAEEDFDLLLAYHPTADEYQHAGLITEPMQWAYSSGSAFAAAEGLKRIGASLDRSVAALWTGLDPARDALVVVSDHGMAPIFEIVGANRVLAGAGLLKIVEENGRSRISPDTPMVATPSAACIHLYLNLAGREPGGVVDPAGAPDLLRRAARAFADLEAEGRPVVEKIFTREEAAAVGLDHPNTGDLVVFLASGFAASGRLDGPALEPSRYYGQHGYLAHHDQMCGMLFARGAGIKRTRRAEMPVTAVAPMVASFLGIELGPEG